MKKIILLGKGREAHRGVSLPELKEAPDFVRLERRKAKAYGNSWEREGAYIDIGLYTDDWFPQNGRAVDLPEKFWEGRIWEWNGNIYLAGNAGSTILTEKETELIVQ